MRLFFEALCLPFAAAALEEPRKIIRLSVESHAGAAAPDRCLEALAPLEPQVPWRADVLRYRVSCYERTRDPRLGRARADLAEFPARRALDAVRWWVFPRTDCEAVPLSSETVR